MTKNALLTLLRGLTVTGSEVSLVQTESIGTGATRVNTYVFNGLFKVGKNSFDKFDVPFYVAGELTPSEKAAPKGEETAERIFRAEVASAADGVSIVKQFKIHSVDADKRSAILQIFREDPANAGKYIDQWKMVLDTGTAGNPNFQLYDYTGDTSRF